MKYHFALYFSGSARKIAETVAPGVVFGEIGFFLGQSDIAHGFSIQHKGGNMTFLCQTCPFGR